MPPALDLGTGGDLRRGHPIATGPNGNAAQGLNRPKTLNWSRTAT
jgi:hypothetical protein